MKRVVGDIWQIPCTHLVIPVNFDGVMGRGLSRQVASMYATTAENYRVYVKAGDIRRWYERGDLYTAEIYNQSLKSRSTLVFLPVKNHWHDESDIGFIRHSLGLLRRIEVSSSIHCLVPLVGCGYGEMKPDDVIPVIESVLNSDVYTLVLPSTDLVSKYPQSFMTGRDKDSNQIKHNLVLYSEDQGGQK